MRWSEMRWTAGFRFIAGALLWVACGSTPPPATSADATGTPGGADCVALSGCSMRPNGANDPTITDPLQGPLSCGPVFVYVNGFMYGWHGGYGSFCPDTPNARQVLHDNQKRGYQPGFCSTCLGVPEGWIFVIWKDYPGPTCDAACPANSVGESAPLL